MKKTLTEEEAKVKALAQFLGHDAEEAKKMIEDGDYLVLTDAEAEEKAKEYIKDSLWAFNASFILEECGLDFSGEESLRHMQEKSCEGANDFILSLVEKTCGLEQFVEDAISADGRGHFMSSYDGEENEVEADGQTFYIYRTN